MQKSIEFFRRHTRLSWLLRLAVTLIVVFWILSWIDLRQFQAITISPDWLPLTGMVLTAWLFVFIGALKFWVLFRATRSIPFGPFVLNFLIATSLGTFTPASLGDFSLAALLRREHIPVHESMSVILVDRAVTVCMYGVVFLPLTLDLLLHTNQLTWVPVVFVVGAIVVLGLNGNAAFRDFGRRLLSKFNWPFLNDSISAISNLLRLHPWILVINIGLTLVRCLVAGIVVQLALNAAGEWRAFLPVLLTTNSISLLNLLPVSFAGLGIYEGGGVAILSRLGFDPERVLAGLAYQRAYVILYSLIMLALARLLQNWLRGHVYPTLMKNA